MKFLVIIILVTTSTILFSTPGDILDVFKLAGQSEYGISGLEKDPVDGNIWAAGLFSPYTCKFCKFTPYEHYITKQWEVLSNVNDCKDVAYPYIYNSKSVFVVVDNNPPRLKLCDAENGSYLGSLQDPFFGSYDIGVGVDFNTNCLYLTNEAFNLCKKWNGTEWIDFAVYSEAGNMGVAYGWKHIFVIFSTPTYKIKVFDGNGNCVDEYSLNNWGGKYMRGLCCGRKNAVNNDESVYAAIYYPSQVIVEIEVGNFSDVGIEVSSFGRIKSLYR